MYICSSHICIAICFENDQDMKAAMEQEVEQLRKKMYLMVDDHLNGFHSKINESHKLGGVAGGDVKAPQGPLCVLCVCEYVCICVQYQVLILL